MLKGIDVSHWNNINDVKEQLKTKDFMMIKATEGNNITDSRMIQYVNLAIEKEKLFGFYHYARPELYDAKEEAYYFLSRVAPYLGKCILALDWEGIALKYPIEWAVEFLETIRNASGCSPLIYAQASFTNKLQPVLDKKFNLWVAHWNVNKPDIGIYPFFAMWQTTSSPMDMNLFNGDIDQFKALY